MSERRKRARSSSPDGGHGNHKEREVKRVKLSSSDFQSLSRDKLALRWKEQEMYIDQLLLRLESSGADEVAKLKESENKLQLRIQESTRRENVLNMRLATKQQEMHELASQLHDLKEAQSSDGTQLHRRLIDPAVNIVYERMKAQLKDYKEKLEQAQGDLSAWKFTPDSVTGKKLMAKCRTVIQENQELGKQISQGRVAQLEAEIALQMKRYEEIKTAQDELSEFVLQLDEEVEGMQSKVLAMEKELRDSSAMDSGSAANSGHSGTKESKIATKSTHNGPVETGNEKRSQDS